MNRAAEKSFSLFLLVLFVFLFVVTWRYAYRARLVPLVLLTPAVILTAIQIALSFRSKQTQTRQRADEGEEGGLELDAPFADEMVVLCLFVLLAAMIWVAGFLVAAPIFILIFVRWWGREGWLTSVLISGLATIAIYWIVEVGFRIILYRGWLFS